MQSPSLKLDRPGLCGNHSSLSLLLLGSSENGPLGGLLQAMRPQVALETCRDISQALACLLSKPFDAILILHEPGRLDAPLLLDPLRAGGGEDLPILVLGDMPERQVAEACQQAGADSYLCLGEQSPAMLAWQVEAGIERRRILAENRRLRLAERRRLQHEHDEIEHLLAQQHSLLTNLESIQAISRADLDPVAVAAATRVSPSSALPESLLRRYRELLQALVVMGTGSLVVEMKGVVAELLRHHVSAQRTMLLHLEVVEEMVCGLGNRSARHVLNRADLLIVEVMMHLAEAWRERAGGCRSDPRAA